MRALALPLIMLVACGGSSDPAPAKSADPIVAATATASASVAPPAAPAPPPKKHRPYEIVSLCPNVATILFGEDPKAPNVGSRTVAGNGRIDDAPRDNDGNQVIWLMVRGEALVRVHVSRGTKRVEIGTSCDTLEMH